mgnify:CR=1 FL=1
MFGLFGNCFEKEIVRGGCGASRRSGNAGFQIVRKTNGGRAQGRLQTKGDKPMQHMGRGRGEGLALGGSLK